MNAAIERNSSRRGNNHRRVHATPAENASGSRQSGRRRRSRSPEGRGSQHQSQANAAPKPEIIQSDPSKRKKSNNPPLISTSSRPFIVAIDEVTSDRGRKSKSKPRSHNRHLTENATSSTLAHASDLAMVKRERSKSRESSKIPSKTTSDVESSARDLRGFLDAQNDYSGPLAAAEYSRMKREYDNWKKLAHENKKTVKKQSKLIDELKQQENTMRQKLKESESQIQKLQSKSKKSDEIINNVESNAQCQICMELLFKPYALSPCGHVLCVGCLQEWFRKAPAGDDDMYDEDDPDYLVRRRKTCPCCRTRVRRRPIPIFMIKAIAAAIGKAKGNSLAASSPSREPAGDLDPWEGLFPTDDEDFGDYDESDEDEDEDEDEDDDYEDEDDEDSGWYDEVFSYGTNSDEDAYEGNYVHPQWAPPSVVVDEEDYLFEQLDESDLSVLRRGATLGMLQLHDMQYSHEEGLVAHDEANNRMYLGWNVRLSADDESGEAYMRHLARDMLARPERWNVVYDDDDGFEAHLLVPEEAVYDYRDTDSENYMDLDDLD